MTDDKKPVATEAEKPTAKPAEPPPDPKLGPKPGPKKVEEIGGPPGPEPTRYGDWQFNGKVTDF